MESITRRDVIGLLDEIVAEGKPQAASEVLTRVRRMYSWAIMGERLHLVKALRGQAGHVESNGSQALGQKLGCGDVHSTISVASKSAAVRRFSSPGSNNLCLRR